MRKIMLLLALAAAAVLAVGIASAASVKTQTVHLKGSAEIPKGSAKGKGTFRFQLVTATGKLCYSLKWSGIGSPTAAHVHKGKAGVAGNIVIVLSGTPPVAQSGCVNASKKLLKAIKKNPKAYYVNVHTVKYPGGAIRAQL
jgi:hypothetical protein